MTCFFPLLTISLGKFDILSSLFLISTSSKPAYQLVVSFLVYTLSLQFILLFTETLIYLMQDYYHHRSFSGSLLSKKQSPNFPIPSVSLGSHFPLLPSCILCCIQIRSLTAPFMCPVIKTIFFILFSPLRIYTTPYHPNIKLSTSTYF